MTSLNETLMFRVFSAIETSNIGLAIIANIFLMFLIQKSSKELGSYRFLLFAFALNDIWFPLVHALTTPIISSYKDAFIMFSRGVFTNKFSICLFASAHAQTMPIMAHLFIYQLIMIRWPNYLKHYTPSKTILFILGTVVPQGILWFANCWYNYNADQELQEYVTPFLNETFPGEEHEVIGALYYNETGAQTSKFYATMEFDSIMGFWLSIIGACSVLITNSLRTSKNTEHKQMFRTLLILFTVTIVCAYLPCAGIINLPMFFQMDVTPNLVSAALSFFPTLDAIITMVCVKIIRKKLFAVLCRGLMYEIESRVEAELDKTEIK